MNEFNEERETEPFVKQEHDDDESLGSNDVLGIAFLTSRIRWPYPRRRFLDQFC
jgi:hypothetical protein